MHRVSLQEAELGSGRALLVDHQPQPTRGPDEVARDSRGASASVVHYTRPQRYDRGRHFSDQHGTSRLRHGWDRAARPSQGSSAAGEEGVDDWGEVDGPEPVQEPEAPADRGQASSPAVPFRTALNQQGPSPQLLPENRGRPCPGCCAPVLMVRAEPDEVERELAAGRLCRERAGLASSGCDRSMNWGGTTP